jgi:hypothetical protein
MATMTVSYGTKMWVAELIRAGWTAQAMRKVDGGVGVLVTDDKGNGQWIPCPCEHDAIQLLDDALEEAQA